MKNFNVAYCGLYCAECRSFKKGSCPGCYDNKKPLGAKLKNAVSLMVILLVPIAQLCH